ncbi:MAG TPA: hypothetical protein VN668_20305 [Stellaceae bacterium]|nr:hypothetical protein [Stellaceae bacterium]
MRLLAASAVLLTSSFAQAQQAPAHLTLYKTVSSAACSDDKTVWIDPKTGIYYVKGEALYGKTRPGGYNCRRQAEAAGYRSARQH